MSFVLPTEIKCDCPFNTKEEQLLKSIFENFAKELDRHEIENYYLCGSIPSGEDILAINANAYCDVNFKIAMIYQVIKAIEEESDLRVTLTIKNTNGEVIEQKNLH